MAGSDSSRPGEWEPSAARPDLAADPAGQFTDWTGFEPGPPHPGPSGRPGPAESGYRQQFAAPARGRRRKAKRENRSLLRELPVLVIVALVIAMVIKTFVVQAFVIPTGSMQNTLGIDDKILVSKLVYHLRPVHAGDIVVFDGAGSWDPPASSAAASQNPLARAYDDSLRRLFDSIGGLFGTPIGQTDYVKRVIGVPGDHVVCCNAQGLITVNGVPLHELSYLYPGDRPGSHPQGIPGRFNVTVPAGYLWVLGDHRSISDDSRGHEADPGAGLIPADEVIGRAFVIVWPVSQWRILPIPSTFEQPGITRTASSAAGRASTDRFAAGPAAAPLRPAAPYLPAVAGFAVALPFTWLRRTVRGRTVRGRTVRGQTVRRAPQDRRAPPAPGRDRGRS